MESAKIKIADKEYDVLIAQSDDEKSEGLEGINSLDKNEGMLFIINSDDKDEDIIWFTMENTNLELDVIFLNEDLEVVQVAKGEPNSDVPIFGEADYVLEVNSNSGISLGDELEFISEESKKMYVLDSKGDIQMVLDGGERIFSIPNTKTLIKFAKKAASMKNDNAYKALGKRVFKFLTVQNESETEYVKS